MIVRAIVSTSRFNASATCPRFGGNINISPTTHGEQRLATWHGWGPQTNAARAGRTHTGPIRATTYYTSLATNFFAHTHIQSTGLALLRGPLFSEPIDTFKPCRCSVFVLFFHSLGTSDRMAGVGCPYGNPSNLSPTGLRVILVV